VIKATLAPGSAGPAGTAEVMARYDELAALLASVELRPAGDPALSARCAAMLAREARLLDHRRLDTWLEWFAVDAVVWVPLAPHAHPAGDQSLYLDDRRRLAERVAWHADPASWGQHPPSTCVRSVGGVEAWSDGDDRVVVHSTVTLVEQRTGRLQVLAGRQVHELVDDASRCRSKVVVMPRLAIGVRNPSVLL